MGKINLLTGAGSKITDPLGLYPAPPQAPMPPPPPASGFIPWTGNSKSDTASQRAAAAVAGTPQLPSQDDDTETKNAAKTEVLGTTL